MTDNYHEFYDYEHMTKLAEYLNSPENKAAADEWRNEIFMHEYDEKITIPGDL